MSAGRSLGYGLLGLVIGVLSGGLIGLGGGLGWVTLRGTSHFEGYSGYVVIYWILLGLLIGAVTGPAIALRHARGKSLPGEGGTAKR